MKTNNNTIKINDKKLAKYQDLFFYAAKVAGRIIFKNKGTHDNLSTAISLYEYHYSNLFPHNINTNKNTPLSSLITSLISFNDYEIYYACEEFFNDVVTEVAYKENKNIEYNLIIGQHCLYGVNSNKELISKKYQEYINYLLDNGYSKEEIDTSVRIVEKPSNLNINHTLNNKKSNSNKIYKP